jgi:hypothetical protein
MFASASALNLDGQIDPIGGRGTKGGEMFSKHGRRIALVLAAAAITTPATQAADNPPRPSSVATAFGFLAQQGMTPRQIEAWTTGVCSNVVKPSSCYLTRTEARLASERTAQGFLQASGMTERKGESWTTGACSNPVKPSSCYLTQAEARLASERTAEGFLGTQSYQPSQVEILHRGGFDWGDAGIGAAVAVGMALLLATLGATLVISRHNHVRPARRS